MFDYHLPLLVVKPVREKFVVVLGVNHPSMPSIYG
jgi:hypothetical protein